MSIQPPLTELDIETADSGFYEGFSKVVHTTRLSQFLVELVATVRQRRLGLT